MYPFRFNLLHIYLGTCSTFNQNINKNTIHDIWKVLRVLKSHRNGIEIRTNQRGNYGGLLGNLETWFRLNGLGNILSFNKVEKFFVIQ